MNPVLLMATAITGVAVALSAYRDELVTIGTKTASVGDWVAATWDYVKTTAENMGTGIALVWTWLFGDIKDSNLNILDVVKSTVNLTIALFKTAYDSIVHGWETMPTNLRFGVFK